MEETATEVTETQERKTAFHLAVNSLVAGIGIKINNRIKKNC
jgi:hypothetical protein